MLFLEGRSRTPRLYDGLNRRRFLQIGGLGLFFLGLRFLTESLQVITGDVIRRMINSATTNRIIAVFVGLSVTALIQSSSISTVMVVGMVNAGLMDLMV